MSGRRPKPPRIPIALPQVCSVMTFSSPWSVAASPRPARRTPRWHALRRSAASRRAARPPPPARRAAPGRRPCCTGSPPRSRAARCRRPAASRQSRPRKHRDRYAPRARNRRGSAACPHARWHGSARHGRSGRLAAAGSRTRSHWRYSRWRRAAPPRCRKRRRPPPPAPHARRGCRAAAAIRPIPPARRASTARATAPASRGEQASPR